MDARKLINELSPSNDHELYTFLVADSLNGKNHPEILSKLPVDFQKLILVRDLIKANDHAHATNLLDSITPTNAYVEAEKYFLTGVIEYGVQKFMSASINFEKATSYYNKLAYIHKSLLSKFNQAQCIQHLGRPEESYKMELELLTIAEEMNSLNIKALVLRSLAYQNLRKNNTEEAKDFFKRAKTIFSNLKNESDGIMCLFYEKILQLCHANLNEIPQILLELKSVPEGVDERFDLGRKWIVGYIDGTSLESLQQLYALCDHDQQLAISTLLKHQTHIKIPKIKNLKLSDKLIQLLKTTGGCTPAECIKSLWNNEGSIPSLEQRLWTLISRINNPQKIIFFDGDEKYRIR